MRMGAGPVRITAGRKVNQNDFFKFLIVQKTKVINGLIHLTWYMIYLA